jgi:hypothetical protein
MNGAVAVANPHPNRHPEGPRPCAQGEGLLAAGSSAMAHNRVLSSLSDATWGRRDALHPGDDR